MIVDFERQFVFVHIPKTAGTSIHRALRQKNRVAFRRLRQRLHLPLPVHIRAVAPRTKHETWGQFVANFTERTGLPVELALELRPFAACRNPFSRFTSLHKYLLGRKNRGWQDIPSDVSDFARQFAENRLPRQESIRSLKTQLSFIRGCEERAFIARFENLETDVARFGQEIGTTLALPHVNKSRQANGDPSRNVLTSEARAIVRERFDEDFEFFGYGGVDVGADPIPPARD